MGQQVRHWRDRRRLSQLQLASQAEISTRHLSFIETGRAQPSREMLLRLASHLDVPLRDRNSLLLAAGYAPLFEATSMEAPQMASVRSAIRRVLTGHEPFPALVMDRDWNLVEANSGLDLFTAEVAPDLVASPMNMIRLALHPDGLSSRILNLAEWRAHLLGRLRRRITMIGDSSLGELYEELCGYPGSQQPGDPDGHDEPDVVMPMQLRYGKKELSLFCTVAVFGSPLDITVAELAIETFFPADGATGEFLRARQRTA